LINSTIAKAGFEFFFLTFYQLLGKTTGY